MNRLRLGALGLALACAMGLSCNVNEYCISCSVDDAGLGDGGDGGNGDGGDATTSGDGGPCVPAGIEVCDGKDNDCNGIVDDGILPSVGEPCDNQVGECAGGVKQCTNGAITCTKPPKPEQCNNKDDDCDGTIDNGDPGGGAKCGTDQGECVAGRLHCDPVTHTLTCGLACATANAFDCPIGGTAAPFGVAETCNGKDDDCDSNFDEDVPPQGACGGGPPGHENDGLCKQGVAICDGAGGTICSGSPVGPKLEVCDHLDNDCDGVIDNGFDTNTDPLNCGDCSVNGDHVCNLAHAFEGCAGGLCTIVACDTGFVDEDKLAADGCEYQCTIQSSVEVCNGIDDDCDRSTGPNGVSGTAPEVNLPPPNNFCLTLGACAGSTASCQGALGFRCNYGTDVSLDANGSIQPETLCDGIDNDCDGLIDEGQTNLGQACDDGGLGECKGRGTFQCNPNNRNGPAICVITSPGATPKPELCNGKDDDCDGVLDNNATDDMVAIKDSSNTVLFRIDAYEASRPDASATSIGTMSHRACSRPLVIPWSSITETQANQACSDAGKRLCTAAEWELACGGLSGTKYPYGNTYQPNACNGNDYDPDCVSPDDDFALPTGTPDGCPTKPAQSACVSAAGAFDMSGNLKEWTSTPVQASAFSVRGGGFDTAAGGMTCQFNFVAMDSSFSFPNLGFRCCSGP